MGNDLPTTNQLYTNVKTADSVCTILICSTLCSELEFKAEIKRDVLEFGINKREL